MGVRKVLAAADALVIQLVQTVLAQGLEVGRIEKAQQSVLFAIVRVMAGCIVLRKREDAAVFVTTPLTHQLTKLVVCLATHPTKRVRRRRL